MMELRWYQSEAVNAVYNHLQNRNDNPVVVLPTAAGKSFVIAQIVIDTVQRWSGRVIVLAHVKELLEQNAEKIRRLCPEVPIGLYSAGLNRREVDKPAIVAGIQSVYKRACELGPFDLVVVDECHLIPPDGEGMYRTFLAEASVLNPHMRVIGLTATPFRLTSGPICSPENVFNHVCYEVSVRELIRDGYLCPLVTKASIHKTDFSELHIRGGEFVAEEAEKLMNDNRRVVSACSEIVNYTRDRKSVLIFAAGVKHGKHVAKVLAELSGEEVGFLDGETPTAKRAELIARFRGDPCSLMETRPLKYLVNVNVLTTGFDAPNIDCIAILRPTMSPGLFGQMCGRGFRLHPGKANCLILDFGGNALRHGPVDQLRIPKRSGSGDGPAPVKECPECHSIIAAGYMSCPDCGHAFPSRENKKHDTTASTANILSLSGEYEVLDTRYTVHIKRNAPLDSPRTMRVDYRISLGDWISEWVCFEHTGYPRRKAEQWWLARSNEPVPETAEEAIAIAEAGGLAITEKIFVRTPPGEKYARIVGYKLGEKPQAVFSGGDAPVDDDEVPF